MNCPNPNCNTTGLPEDAKFCPNCGCNIIDVLYQNERQKQREEETKIERLRIQKEKEDYLRKREEERQKQEEESQKQAEEKRQKEAEDKMIKRFEQELNSNYSDVLPYVEKVENIVENQWFIGYTCLHVLCDLLLLLLIIGIFWFYSYLSQDFSSLLEKILYVGLMVSGSCLLMLPIGWEIHKKLKQMLYKHYKQVLNQIDYPNDKIRAIINKAFETTDLGEYYIFEWSNKRIGNFHKMIKQGLKRQLINLPQYSKIRNNSKVRNL